MAKEEDMHTVVAMHNNNNNNMILWLCYVYAYKVLPWPCLCPAAPHTVHQSIHIHTSFHLFIALPEKMHWVCDVCVCGVCVIQSRCQWSITVAIAVQNKKESIHGVSSLRATLVHVLLARGLCWSTRVATALWGDEGMG